MTVLPSMSIITPCLNASPFIEDAIRSVMDQRYPAVEHIVIDGGSQDGTLSLLRSHPHLRWISEPDNGQTEALNKGLKMARGDIIGWLNADDYYLPGAFHSVARCFERRPDADIVYGDFDLVDQSQRMLRHVRNTPFDARILFYYRNYIPSNATFWRRSIHERGHFPDISFKVVMDWEWWLRLSVLGFSFHFLPVTLAAFRVRRDNIGTRYAHLLPEERDRIRERFDDHFTRRAIGKTRRTFLSYAYMAKRVLLKLPGRCSPPQ
jgi:glycosyltransferase involved in cell wall biosynthesis